MMKRTEKLVIIRGGVTERYEVIEFMKGFSILTVVFMHLIQIFMIHTSQIIKLGSSLGGTGVHLFIFCSGFGLYLSQLRKGRSFIDFIRKRCVRIYAPYICVVIISSILPFMYTQNDRVPALLSHVFLFKMFVPEYMESFGMHFWFISSIIQMYLLFIPLCKLKLKLGQRKFFAVCMILSAVWWLFLILTGRENIRIYNGFCLQYLWEFALGMCAAEYLHEGQDICMHQWKLLLAAVIGIGIEGAMALAGGVLKVLNDIPAFGGYAALVLFLYSFVDKDKIAEKDPDSQTKKLMKTPTGSSWIQRAALFLASISYELYLVHILVFSIMFYIFHSSSLITDCVIGISALLLSILVAWGYSLFMKKIK